MIKRLLTCILLLASSLSYGQKISILRSELDGEKVNIFYDLEGEAEGQLFEVSLLSSVNKFTSPLVFVQGEVGKNIKGGKEKKIIWNAGKELLLYKGNISFEIKAKLTHSPLIINNPVSGQSLKRGKTYPVSWRWGIGGVSKIELLKGDNLVLNIPHEGKNSADLILPPNIKPGNYTLKLTAGNGAAGTADLKIKRKIPLALKVAPALLLGGVAIIILSSKGKDGRDQGESLPQDLPMPPSNP